jgi:ribosomal protein S17
MNPKKQFNRYIPSLIKDELDQLTHTRKDNLYTIIDLINRKEIYYKSDLQRTYGYTEIALAQFKELLPTSNNLNEDIQFLIDNNFIRRNNFYTIGAKCKSYKISSEYLGKTIGIKIQNININKRIAKQIEKNKRMKVKSLEFAKSEYYKTFKVDIDGANKAILKKTIQEFKNLCLSLEFILSEKQMRDIIDCKKESLKNRMLIIIRKEGKELHDILHRYMIYSTRINAINDGFLFFKRNKTNGRLDSNLTSLPSFLRPFIISNEPLMNIDIKNSQPYFLYTLIQNKTEIDKEELSKYKDLVIEGTIYEFLVKKYKIYTGIERTRNQMKEMLFKVYYSKNSSFEKLKQFYGLHK